MKEVIMQVPSFSADYPKAPIYVAELVRCGECIYWKNSLCQAWHRVIPKDGYCSIGERDVSTQTETQNSNLTFEKDECAKEYAEGVWNAGFKTGYDKGYKDAQKVKDSQDLVKDLVKAFCEDGTWLERQGVYTLTLAEAKQRAVDIIESVTASTEPQTCEECEHWNDTEDGCADRHGCKDETQTDCPWK